jgi:hypothetical protein
VKKIKIYLLTVTVFLPILNLVGQNDEKNNVKSLNHFLEIGLGLNNHGVRDKGTSPLIYDGFLPSFHLEYFIKGTKFLGIAENSFSIGYLKTRNYPTFDSNRATSYNEDLSLRTYFEIGKSKNSVTRYYLGGDLNLLANIRINDKFNNASLNYEFIASLAPSFLVEYKTGWKAKSTNSRLFGFKKRDREIYLQFSTSVPLLSDILRPGYVTINDFVDNTNNAININNFKFASINKLFIVNNRFTVYYMLHNLNMLKLEYKFGYFNYAQPLDPVQGFYSSIMLSIVFRFSNN